MAKAQRDSVKAFLAGEILAAVKGSDLKKITDCLAKGADIETRTNDDQRRTLLLVALFDVRDKKLVQHLLNSGADLYAEDAFHRDAFKLVNAVPLSYRSGSMNTGEIKEFLLEKLPKPGDDPAAQQIDPRVKEDTQSAPIPELKKKPFTPGGASSTGGP